MEFDKTRLPCPRNSDQNCTQNSTRGCRGLGVVEGLGGFGSGGWWGSWNGGENPWILRELRLGLGIFFSMP